MASLKSQLVLLVKLSTVAYRSIVWYVPLKLCVLFIISVGSSHENAKIFLRWLSCILHLLEN